MRSIRTSAEFSHLVNKPWFLRVCNTSLSETIMGKGEIACNKQFLLFPECFLLSGMTEIPGNQPFHSNNNSSKEDQPQGHSYGNILYLHKICF